MYQGANFVSVASSIMSRAREYSNHLLREHRSVGLSFHWRSGSVMRASKRRFCSLSLTSSQNLISRMPSSTTYCLELGTDLEEAPVLRLRAEAHHVLDPGPVVPTAVEDHDFAGRRGVLQVALHVQLGLLAVGRRRQRHHAEDARADALGDRLDRAALAGGVPSLEDHDHPLALFLHPVLQERTARPGGRAGPSRIPFGSSARPSASISPCWCESVVLQLRAARPPHAPSLRNSAYATSARSAATARCALG